MASIAPPLLAISQNLTTFLTPIWLLAVGVALGFLILLVLWGVLALVSRPAALAVRGIVSDGVLRWVTYGVFVAVAIAILAGPIMPYRQAISSVRRSASVGATRASFPISAGAEDQAIGVEFLSDELVAYSFESNRELLFAQDKGKTPSAPLFVIRPNEPFEWSIESPRGRLFAGHVDEIYVSNPSESEAELVIQTVTEVGMPQVYGLTTTALAVVCVYLAYILMCWLAPRLSAISVATTREAVSQPLYLVLLGVGVIALVVFVFIPYHTFGEDVKMLKDVGMTLIMVLSIVVALWTASISVAEEIEGRTALTLLSKPIGRPQFVLGKFAGISWAVFMMFVVLGTVLLITISYKVIYDARESAATAPEWQECYTAIVSTVPGLVLAFLEAVVMASISVAISTRLPMLPNLIICGSVYVLGHLVPLIVASAAGENVFVAFVGRLIATILPVLVHFNVQAAVTAGVDVPMSYIAWTTLYGALYCTASMLLALFLFHDRDLA